MGSQPNTTQLLNSPEAVDALLDHVFDRLQSIARWAKGRTVDPQLETDLVVNEAWMKVQSGGPRPWADKEEFFKVVACAMRQVVITYCRKRRMGPLPGSEVLADDSATAPEDQVMFNDLTDFFARELRQFAAVDPEA